MTERKLATIRTISYITPIEGADKIELAHVDGWQVVVKKDEFSVGDLCIYIEIDSWVPTTLAPFLSKGKEPKVFEGIQGERLRTIKLKKTLSQGLMLPLKGQPVTDADIGDDVTEQLGIIKYEKPIPASLRGLMKGNFPTFIPKTDQERIQNCFNSIQRGVNYQITEKLDGSSMTMYHWPEGTYGVCSRNIDLKMDQEGNTFVDTAKAIGLYNIPVGWAIQGELCGPGIQGNQYELTKPEYFVYDIWDIKNQCYFTPQTAYHEATLLNLQHVPVLEYKHLGDLAQASTFLRYAEGKSVLNDSIREGVVFKADDGSSFKVINNTWLMKNE